VSSGVASPALAATAASSPHEDVVTRTPAGPATVTEATPAASQPAASANLDWPATGAPRALSEKLAFRDLFRLYGISYDPAARTAPCKAATAAMMRCLAGRGGLADLLRFNQPALLSMETGRARYHVVLAAIEGQAAVFSVAGETRRVPLAEIAPAWSGNYVLLWKAPPGIKDELSPGSHGPAVAWLRKSLAEIAGEQAHGPAAFDDELFRRVKAFQLSEGIVPDGVVGALTVARLNMRLDQEWPRLSPNAESSQNVVHP
jgi:general secretion pathway protein A